MTQDLAQFFWPDAIGLFDKHVAWRKPETLRRRDPCIHECRHTRAFLRLSIVCGFLGWRPLKTRIKALRAAFPDLAEPLDAILGRLADLLFYVTEFVYHPDFKGSFSIKKVLPVLVPGLSYKGLAVADGDTAITRFARMARGEIVGEDVELTRRQLLEYCERDTFAMLRLHEMLQEISSLRATAPAG